MRRIFALLLLPCLSIVGLAEESPIRIGAIMHLTGDFAMYGTAFREGVELAASTTNEQGGIRGRKLSVIFEDSEMTPVKAHTAAMKLLDIDNVTAGLITTMTEAKSAGTVFERHKKPLICLWDSAPQLDELGEYVFGIGAWLPGSGEVAARFAFEDLHARTAGIIAAANDEASENVSSTFSKLFQQLGGKIVVEQHINPQNADFRSVLLKNRAADPAVLYAPFGYNQPAFIKQLRESRFKGDVIFLDTLSEEVIRQSGEGAEGVYQTQVGDPEGDTTSNFLTAYRKHFGKDPSSTLFAAWGYDGMNLLTMAMREVGDEPKAISSWLYKVHGYAGASGTIDFTREGSSRVYPKMYQVRSGKLVLAKRSHNSSR